MCTKPALMPILVENNCRKKILLRKFLLQTKQKKKKNLMANDI